jgi:hypothetical protein
MLHGEVWADRAFMVDVSDLYTKNGGRCSGQATTSTRVRLLSRTRVRNGKAYDPSGKYAGTIVGDRVVYRGTDGATSGPREPLHFS